MQRSTLLLATMAAMTATGSVAKAHGNASVMPTVFAPSSGRHTSNNKYGHLTWKESRPENAELRHRNEAERARARKAG